MVAPLLIGAGASLAGGLLGQAASAGDRAASSQMLQDLLMQYQNLNTPDVDALKVYLEQQQSMGDLVPQQEALVGQLGPSALGAISLDPALRAQQMEALNTIAETSKEGMSAVDRAQLDELLRTNAAATTAAQKSVLQNRQSRGMGGGGDELAAMLGNTQSAANRGSSESLKIAAEAANRRLNATDKSANLAAAIEASDYNRAAAKAGANDAIANFNAQLKQGLEGRKNSSANNAQERNLANKQTIANNNTATRNQQQQYNTNLTQQDFENKLKKLGGVASATTGASQNLQNNANATAQMWSNIGTGAGAIGANYMNQKK